MSLSCFQNGKSLCSFTSFVIFISLVGSSFVPAQGQSALSNQAKTVPPDHVQKAQKGLSIFKNHVREILTKHCLDCHGGKSIKADFSLATRSSLMESGFVGEKAEDSYLFELVTHESEPTMPLKEERLSEEKINWIRQWIDLGAPYDKPLADGELNEMKSRKISDDDREFWSFQPLNRIDPPSVKTEQWCRTPIDFFILSDLEKIELTGNPDASARTLIRRGSLDAVGLPPQIDVLENLVDDFGDDQWNRYVEQLLDSPHFGERWARHWMDVARFAESHGYEQDYDRPHAYHYRDFLIKAFNQDMPFDQFTRWQIAGDELAPGNPLAMMATGFLGAGVFPTQLTEAEFESARYDELDDMVATTGVTFLGLSIGCARCHDHKFDPITSADYYSIAANFTSTIRSEVELDLDPDQNARKREQWQSKLQENIEKLDVFEKNELESHFADWLDSANLEELESKWQPLKVLSVTSDAGTIYQEQPDGSWLVRGSVANKENISIEGRSSLDLVNQIRLEALTDKSLPNAGPGGAGNGNFALGDIRVYVEDRASSESQGEASRSWIEVDLVTATATHQQNTDSLSVAASIDDDEISGWAVDFGGIGKDQAAVFSFDAPVKNRDAIRWKIALAFQHPNPKHVMGRFRISFSQFGDAPVSVGSEGISEKVMQALLDAKESKEQRDAWKIGLNWYKQSHPEWSRLSAEIESLRATGPPTHLTKVMVSSEGLPHLKHHADGRGYPHFYPQTFVLERGDVEQKKEPAEPGFLTVLTPPDVSAETWQVRGNNANTRLTYRRSALANWMTDVEAGAGALLARVIVNRIWQFHFGQGLVATPNDFGLSGAAPSHPELLDWLASELIENDWRLKPIHQLIMNSSVYMQSSQSSVLQQKVDPDNQWLSRWVPRRAEGEVIRDSMLSISGLLDPTMYGPGTLNENMKRRSIYFFIKRSKLIPSMMLFDWPEHLVSIGKRSQTTIAPQALSFLNSPQGREYAKALASALKGEDSKHVADEVFRLALARSPSEVERQIAIEFLDKQTSVYRDQKSDQSFQNACVDLCQMILSTNEFIYIE